MTESRRWDVCAIVNETSFSQVQLIKHAVSGDVCVVKKVIVGWQPKNELDIWKSLIALDVPVVMLHLHWEENNIIHMIMERAPLGDLFDYVQRSTPSCYQTCLIAHQIGSTLKCMHDLGFAHMDVSLENILCFTNTKFKLCDFGLIQERWIPLNSMKGKINYCAPELWNATLCSQSTNRLYDVAQADVFSLGVVLLMVQFKLEYFQSAQQSDQNWIFILTYGLKSVLPKDTPLFLMQLFIGMLNPDPVQRWTMKHVLNYIETGLKYYYYQEFNQTLRAPNRMRSSHDFILLQPPNCEVTNTAIQKPSLKLNHLQSVLCSNQ